MSDDPMTAGERKKSGFPVRTFLFFSLVLGITGFGGFTMADYLWELGWTFSSGVLWVLFVVLFGYLAFGFAHAFFGFVLRRFAPRISRMPEGTAAIPEAASPRPRVAIVIPVYNEPVGRVFAGLRALYASVQRQADQDVFDFFLLSDSTKPEQWIAEERAWMEAVRDLGAQDRIFYRHRPSNVNKKSGNVSDFCRTWGDHYRYMIVLDADSIMMGETLVELYRRMEANPGVALIQTAPGIVGGESLFGRMQQFANRLYGAVFMEGLAFWQQDGGNFWGHNAIIRLRPFIEQCELPELPGRRPFGGHILSHDFVEAGLLRRAGWEVWIAHDLGGSYEEGPQGVVEFAQRDQRWCQGNMQHGMLLFARGLAGKTRVHLANGILGYAASPLWLLFMATAFRKAYLTDPETLRKVGLSADAWWLFGVTLVLLFGPKVLCLIDLAFDRERVRGFGGWFNAFTSSIVETFFSALLAPVMMLFHTKFVIWNLFGKTVDWAAQRRGAQGTSWDEAIAAHGLQTLFGVVVAVVAALTNPMLFWWLSPVLVGLWFAIPVSVWTSRQDIGLSAKREKLFQTPEETDPPAEIVAALEGSTDTEPAFGGITDAVLDPFLNAVHVSLLRRARRRLMTGQAVYGERISRSVPSAGESTARRNLAEKLLREGPRALETSEIVDVLSDIDNMLWLHRQAWLQPAREVAPWWNRAIRETAVAG